VWDAELAGVISAAGPIIGINYHVAIGEGNAYAVRSYVYCQLFALAMLGKWHEVVYW
jgi:hypothetical protein